MTSCTSCSVPGSTWTVGVKQTYPVRRDPFHRDLEPIWSLSTVEHHERRRRPAAWRHPQIGRGQVDVHLAARSDGDLGTRGRDSRFLLRQARHQADVWADPRHLVGSMVSSGDRRGKAFFSASAISRAVANRSSGFWPGHAG